MQHPKCCTKNLTIFKFDTTSSNMLQHIATWWPNVCNMLCPTMLQDVVLKCCERLARPLRRLESVSSLSNDALIRRIGTTTLSYVLAILWYQMKHELLLNKIQSLL